MTGSASPTISARGRHRLFVPYFKTMDWTQIIGRYRPVEQDAVRVLTVIHQLGRQPADIDRWFIDTESQLQNLDHLVRHPIDLAYLVIDQVRSRGTELEASLGDLARDIRQLLATPRRRRHRPSRLRPFDPGSWQRWDDILAVLGCRGLLRVEPLPVPPSSIAVPSVDHGDLFTEQGRELRYRLTADGARWLTESVYPSQGDRKTPHIVASGSPYRERCELLRAVLPDHLLRPRSHATLGAYLQETALRLDSYRRDEQIQLEDDLLGCLFQSTFAEEL